METLFPTRNEATRTTCSANYRKLSPVYSVIIYAKFSKNVRNSQVYGPLSRLWVGPVLVVVLTDPDSIEKVVKHDKLCRRGYLAKKLIEPAFRSGLMEKNSADIVKSNLQLFM